MTTPEQERGRIAGVYSGMSDEELERVAATGYELSEIAHQALGAEISRRRLSVAIAESPGIDVYEFNETVTLRKFRDLPEALLAKGSLESAGIEAYLVDDNMIRMDWFYSNLLGGIKLKVRTQDVDAASEILSQPIPEAIEVEGVGSYLQPKCPECQSLDVSYRQLNKLVSYGTLYLGVPIPLQTKAWTCQACQYEWEEQGGEAQDEDAVNL
jgi:DNA-directed RNA polymerase subunit M/transcription elongation factor TFIIS